MTRVIKFRVWVPGLNMYLYSHSYHNLALFFQRIGQVVHLGLEQYIGIKDTQGDELYEGSVVHSEDWNPHHFEIVFESGCFCFYSQRVEGYYNDCKYLPKFFKVVGNIHENKDLL